MYYIFMIDWWLIVRGYPFRWWWSRWQHRHETIGQRDQRLASTKVKLRAIYKAHVESLSDVPESRVVMEARAIMNEVMDKVLGPEKTSEGS